MGGDKVEVARAATLNSKSIGMYQGKVRRNKCSNGRPSFSIKAAPKTPDQQLSSCCTPLVGNNNIFLRCDSVYMNYIVSYHTVLGEFLNYHGNLLVLLLQFPTTHAAQLYRSTHTFGVN